MMKFFFKEQQSNKNSQQIINKLLIQNTQIKQQYENILKENEQLKAILKKHLATCQFQCNNYLDLQTENQPQNGRLSIQFNNKFQDNLIQEIDQHPHSQGQIPHHSLNLQKHSSIDQQKLIVTTPPKKQHPIAQTTPNQNRNSRSSRASSSTSQKYFPLIEGCFIIQKKKATKIKQKYCLQQMIQYIYPQSLQKTQKSYLQTLLKYIFTQPNIIKVQDDQFNSRKNQIYFGTPFDQYQFAFQPLRSKRQLQIPDIMKQMGIWKKKYYHILLKPQIIQPSQIQTNNGSICQQAEPLPNQQNVVNTQQTIKQSEQHKQNDVEQNTQYFYETEVIFGFISPFPFRLFFQDLHRTIQQQLKYSQFSIDEQKQQVQNLSLNRKKKYQILGQIMQKIYDQKYKINKFPLKHTFITGITKIQINIPTIINLKQLQDTFLNNILSKHHSIGICKLLHYVLAQKSVIILAQDKKTLNQLFQAIRIMIKPFLWTFHCIYLYSNQFSNFMTSPFPIIIGKIQQNDTQQQLQQPNDNQMPYSDFYIVKMTSSPGQLHDKDQYSKPIKKLKKQLEKAQKQKNYDKATLIHKYVHNLKVFIEKGVINSQPTNFHQQFIDTQMVSYYKQSHDQI